MHTHITDDEEPAHTHTHTVDTAEHAHTHIRDDKEPARTHTH